VGVGIAVDASGNAYITGYTFSTNFPTASPIYGSNSWDAFVTKINAAGTSLVYSTYLGGSDYDFGFGIAVDTSGNAYITGYTYSTNFPTVSPIYGSNTGAPDAFVTKINAAGSSLAYSTYLGGYRDDYGYSIAVDTPGNAYITGYTCSTNFPTASPIYGSNAGICDAFVTKINASGNSLVYSTYLGGSDYDYGRSIAVDTSGNAYITGNAYSTNFPTASPIYGSNAGLSDAFVTKIYAGGSSLSYSTYIGGNDDDRGVGIAVDASGNAYITGWTYSTNFPTVSPIYGSNSGSNDVFVAKISGVTPTSDLSITKTDSPDPVTAGNNLTYTVTVTNNGLDGATGVVMTDTLPNGVAFVSATPTQGSCSQSAGVVTCDLGSIANAASGTITIVMTAMATGTITNSASTAGNETDPNMTNNTATAGTTVTNTTVSCNGLLATIVGTSGNDVITGTSGNDVIFGGAGDDIIYGLGGDDVICGDYGNDTIYGGDGNDQLGGNQGNDTLYGEAGNDTLGGGTGTDTCNGGTGTDTASGCETTSGVP
jgi:uncharacterized repeat protein (TIGR01451 family)